MNSMLDRILIILWCQGTNEIFVFALFFKQNCRNLKALSYLRLCYMCDMYISSIFFSISVD